MSDTGPVLRTPRCVVRLAAPADVAPVLRYWSRNGHRYVPPLPAGLLDEAVWGERSLRAREEFVAGVSWKPYVFSATQTEVIGTIALTGLRAASHGIACRLGYAISGAHEGLGLMYESVAAAVAHAFGQMGIVRIEASCDRDNVRSLRLLHRLAFVPVLGLAGDGEKRHLVREQLLPA